MHVNMITVWRCLFIKINSALVFIIAWIFLHNLPLHHYWQKSKLLFRPLDSRVKKKPWGTREQIYVAFNFFFLLIIPLCFSLSWRVSYTWNAQLLKKTLIWALKRSARCSFTKRKWAFLKACLKCSTSLRFVWSASAILIILSALQNRSQHSKIQSGTLLSVSYRNPDWLHASSGLFLKSVPASGNALPACVTAQTGLNHTVLAEQQCNT